MMQNTLPFLVHFGSSSFPFGSISVPFGTMSVPFGSILFPFGSISVPLGSISVPLGCSEPIYDKMFTTYAQHDQTHVRTFQEHLFCGFRLMTLTNQIAKERDV